MRRAGSGKDVLRAAGGILFSFCLILMLLISSVEFVCYYIPGYFEREYLKYDVLKELPGVEMDGDGGLLALTDHMMDYLRGSEDAPSLQFDVTVDGTPRPFFSERELLHMADVRKLFIAAQQLRLGVAALGALILILLRKCLFSSDRAFVRNLLQGMLRGTVLFFALAAVLGLICAVNFQAAFVTFHHLFFSNDLWLLDPSVDWLIRILPQGFFFDTATSILVVLC